MTVQGSGGITMNVARTVGGLFQYAAGVSGAGNLTLNGTVQDQYRRLRLRLANLLGCFFSAQVQHWRHLWPEWRMAAGRNQWARLPASRPAQQQHDARSAQ